MNGVPIRVPANDFYQHQTQSLFQRSWTFPGLRRPVELTAGAGLPPKDRLRVQITNYKGDVPEW